MKSTHSAWLLPNTGNIFYDTVMTTKEIALKTIEQLPEDVSWEEIQERINFIVAVREGLRELDEGKGIPHDEIRAEPAEWLTS
jgi:predicted transcriptional regulator